MKAAYYTLGAVMLALLVMAVAPINAPSPHIQKPKPVREVYVDVDRLVGLHPGSKALAEMEALVSPAGRVSKGGRSAALPATVAANYDSVVQLPEGSRSEIEAEIAQSAISALSQLENDQRRALQARLRANRAVMIESARADITTKVRSIEKTSIFKERSLIAQLGLGLGLGQPGPSRLKAEIEKMALSSSVRGMKTVVKATTQDTFTTDQDPAFKLKQMVSELETVKIDLDRIDGAIDTETTSIRDEARDSIAKLRADSVAAIDAKLAKDESAEKAKIEGGMSAARDEVLAELSASEAGSLEPEEGAPKPVRHGTTTVQATCLASVLSAVPVRPVGAKAQLAAVIRQDVLRVVRSIAADQRMKVTFVRSGRKTPDATELFAHLLREKGSDMWGPVLSPRRG